MGNSEYESADEEELGEEEEDEEEEEGPSDISILNGAEDPVSEA